MSRPAYLRTVSFYYADGTVSHGDFNKQVSDDEIRKHYEGQSVNLGDGRTDRLVKIVCVDFPEQPLKTRQDAAADLLYRIFSNGIPPESELIAIRKYVAAVPIE